MSSTNIQDANTGLSTSVTGEITVGIVLIVFIFLITILIIYLRANGYTGTTRVSSRRLVFEQQTSALPKNALDKSILASLSITKFKEIKKCVEECAVCLCELGEEEEVRLLPKCEHVFHVECIDMWFGSNSTCPLCRKFVTECKKRNELVIEIPVSVPIREVDTSMRSPVMERLRRMVSSRALRTTGGDIEEGSVGGDSKC